MKENKIVKYLEKWWVPFIFWVATFALYNFGELLKISFLRTFSFKLLVVGLVVLLFSTVYQFYKKKWFGALVSLFAIGGTFVFFILVAFAMLFVETVSGDQWADNLKIPENIPISNPLDTEMDGNRPDSIFKVKRKEIDFQLYNSFQPGLYEYDLWTPRIESGKIYLKAYEITQNYKLSEDRLPETTLVEISNQSDTIMKFGTHTNFTIYEGDWGKPYAARFEVWFKPENNGQERKLFERNYKIEGWMH